MTRLEHLKKLPLQKRLQAMENIRKQGSNFMLKYEYEGIWMLAGLFVFQETRQGHDYWINIDYKHFG